MSLFALAILAIIQGITEFLPVSSSGHLILFPVLTGVEDQGLAVDVAVHVGTLVAVMAYFWRDVGRMIVGCLHIVTARTHTDQARLVLLLAIATVPVVIVGAVLSVTGWVDALRNMTVIAWTMIIFGLVLYWFDTRSVEDRTSGEWTVGHAITMGLWQAVALIPGTSRSGATITGARALGYTRTEGARLAMLMSIPTIIASGLLVGIDAAQGGTDQSFTTLAIAAGLACIAAMAALILMMRLLRSVSFTPYVIYRIVFGVILLVIASNQGA